MVTLTRPTLHSFPGDGILRRAHERVGTTAVPLADPPEDSGLEPVWGEPGLPVLGKTLQMLRDGWHASIGYYEKYGEVYWTSGFGQQMVFVVGPEAAKEVLANRGKVYSQSGWSFFIGPFFRRGLMLLDGDEHLLHRRIMQEAFTRPRIAAYLAQVTRIVDAAVPDWPTDEPLLMFPAVKRLSLEVASGVFMGGDPTADRELLIDAFIDTVRAGTGLIRVDLPGPPVTRWSRGLRGRRVLEEYFRERIPAKRASQDDDLFAALTHVETEAGERFSDEDVVNHMIFLMMAAHDTSTITASTMAYYLAKNPAWQERARQESRALGDGPVDLDALERLETLGLIFQEAMRLVAPVPALVRRTTEDVELAGRHVPAGTLVSVAPGAVHRLPDRWTAPETFDPERFAEGRREDKGHRFLSVPFGGGAHKCIGMAFGTAEVKALLHRMLLEYRLEVPADYEVEWDHTSLVVPTDGMPITLRRI